MPVLINTVHVTSAFEKSFRKLPANLKNLATKKDIIFRRNAFESSLHTHKLKGELEGFYAYSVNREYRILFRFLEHDSVIYYDIGTHEIYRH